MGPAPLASPHMPAHACWPARRKRPACWRAYAQWPAKPAHEDVEPPGETQNEGSAQVEEEAGDWRQALELLHTSPQPLVVVLDLLMATFSGEGVLSAVAKDRRLRRRHAFVLVTAAPPLAPTAPHACAHPIGDSAHREAL